MPFTRRLALLRLTAMVAMAVSALLTADHFHPERDFCPLAAACQLAHDSPLGSILGVPTAIVGVAAFGFLFLLTLLPVEWARLLLKPAGAVAAAAGLGFVGYQAFVLRSWCPLCLVVDTAGFVAGVIALTWPPLPVRLSGRRLGGEAGSVRAAWTFAALLAVVAPFAWPRVENPAWETITPLDLTALVTAEGEAAAAPATLTDPLPLSSPPGASSASSTEGTTMRALSATTLPDAPALAPAHEPKDVPGREASPKPRAPAPPQARPQVTVVEYLNAYCAHCRSTHHRLEKVLAETDMPVRRVRIYTWGGNTFPLWARTCAFAETRGLEPRVFAELMRAPSQHPTEIYAAARRAGLDVAELRRALRNPVPAPRLLRDRRISQSAQLRGLPTLDIGRRRLMGEQTETELRAALEAAVHTVP